MAAGSVLPDAVSLPSEVISQGDLLLTCLFVRQRIVLLVLFPHEVQSELLDDPGCLVPGFVILKSLVRIESRHPHIHAGLAGLILWVRLSELVLIEHGLIQPHDVYVVRHDSDVCWSWWRKTRSPRVYTI